MFVKHVPIRYKTKKNNKKLLCLTILHRVVMLVAAYLYLDFVVSITNNYGSLVGAVALNSMNMVIYYIYHYFFLNIFNIEKGA